MRIAFLSIDDLSGYVADDELAIEPLQALGHVVEFVPWQQTALGWKEFAAVIIRTTWDYQHNLREFLHALQQIESQTLLANPLEIVRWNADKTYLSDLEQKGARIVPTIWINNEISSRLVEQWFERLQSDEIIIKPTVSANAQDTFRLKHGAVDTNILSELFHNRTCMVQPFMQRIVTEGEYSLFYFNGEYSHAILKTPKTDDFRVQEEHGGIIQAITPTDDILAAGKKVMNCISLPLLYARADFVRTESDDFALMELELIEPSMYLRTAEDAPRRFAGAIHAWLLEER